MKSSCTRRSSVSSGMERREQQSPVAHEHGLAVELTEHLDTLAEAANAWRPDEHAVKRDLVSGQVDVRLEASHLPSEGISIDDEIGDIEMLAVEHDHPGTGPEDGACVGANRVIEAIELGEPHDRRRLAARNHEAVEAVELLRQTNLDDVGAKLAERRGVLPKGPLQGEDADAQRPLHGRATSRELRAARSRRASSRRFRPSAPRDRPRRRRAPSRRRSASSPRRSPSRASPDRRT